MPTLVLHAPDDNEVPAENARALAASGDHVVLKWIEGAGHRRILGNEASLKAILDFVCAPDATRLTQSDPQNPPKAAA